MCCHVIKEIMDMLIKYKTALTMWSMFQNVPLRHTDKKEKTRIGNMTVG